MLHLRLLEALEVDQTSAEFRGDEACVIELSADVARLRVFLGTTEVVDESGVSLGRERIVIPGVGLSTYLAICRQGVRTRSIHKGIAQAFEERTDVAGGKVRHLKRVLPKAVLQLRLEES